MNVLSVWRAAKDLACLAPLGEYNYKHSEQDRSNGRPSLAAFVRLDFENERIFENVTVVSKKRRIETTQEKLMIVLSFSPA